MSSRVAFIIMALDMVSSLGEKIGIVVKEE
jgi:hypothetical protein